MQKKPAPEAGFTLLSVLLGAVGAGPLVLAGLPGGYGLLLAAAGLSGIAQSFSNGVTNRVLLERVPATQRIGWVGVKQSGVQMSQLVASLAFPLLAVWVGWRGAALVGSLIPLILLLLAWHALSSTTRLGPGTAPRGTTSTSSQLTIRPGPTRHSGTVWALAAFGLLNGIGVQATNTYLPLFAVRELGFSLMLGGATAAVAGVVGVAARVGWARVMARGHQRQRCCWFWH